MPAKKDPTATPALTDPNFNDLGAARAHLEALRWPDGPVCPHCGVVGEATRLDGEAHRKGLLQCNACREQFSVTVGTLFERSHLPLNKWLLAFHLMASSKKGMSAHQMHRMLDITYKTAWFMCHRIREAMKAAPPKKLGGKGKIVEADETYIGRKPGTGRARPGSGNGAKQMNVVVALVERSGDVRSFHVARATSKTLRGILDKNADKASHLMTDEAHMYKSIGRTFAHHDTTKHKTGVYARPSRHTDARAHSNTIEGYFSLLKRGVVGTFHHVSTQHLHRYTAEFDFRYNNRVERNADGEERKITDVERALSMLAGIEGKRLTYRRLDSRVRDGVVSQTPQS